MSAPETTRSPRVTDDASWPSDPVAGTWDLLVVGGGTAGLVAAHTAGDLGASVLLVERSRTGGDCLWTGCVPSKSLLAAGHAAAEARAGGSLGVHVGSVEVDFAAVMAHVRGAIAAIAPVDSPDAVRRSGAAVAQGTVRFTGPRTAEVDGTAVSFRQAVLATGSAPIVPGLPGLRESEPLTSDTVWDLTELPARLLVLGGGPIGCELGQALARLGSQVTIVEAADRVLAREEQDASRIVDAALRADGIDLRTGVALTSVGTGTGGDPTGTPDDQEYVAHLDDGSTVTCDRILVAVGRRPGTADLGLDAAGVELDERGYVVVDDALRTSNPRIRAAGDLTGHPPFTHVAGSHGSLAASNAVLGLRRKVKPDLVPRVTYTSPEVAAFGVAPDGAGVTVRRVEHDEVDRARAEGRTAGYSSLVLDRRGRVVGATVVGPRAGESLAEAVLAAQAGLRARTVAGTMHAYPTWSDGVWKAGLAQGRADLSAPTTRRVTGALRRLRRAWVSR
ncbi:dihydrolipoyl dehydrogenase family protein [Nocardioides donggukensis]|uniref:FAD-dependent oxidoreductase n=1 Tax=Nocardioides donggukensis TaxID=2774019 RepID=A0A927K3T1_9ACTN|nr:FAD-dependent oxidoreductase [Nocardioides donggukensis]MBD8868253.1 FAD-dependent oxidoreductase [Nocardioides donggukensis]